MEGKHKQEIAGRIYDACKLISLCEEVNASYKWKEVCNVVVCSCGNIQVYRYLNVLDICTQFGTYELYTGCPRRNVKYFGRVFLMLNYTDITQNTYIQS